ncbi:MAG: HAMP domain-containing sensor histidine kinase [Lawsonibacter sp.]|nr:HAMP domain-containing sensor histidine kinase [Lawsonibacter sp.]
MIQKLRLKFVAVCMLMVTAVLAVVFVSVHTSAELNIEHISRQVLQRIISEPSIPVPSGAGRYERNPNFGTGKVQLPYFTVEIWGGNAVYVTGGTYSDLEDTDELTAIIRDCMRQSLPEGTIDDYDLRYLRQDNGFFTQIAFVDMSMEQTTLNDLMHSYVQIAAAALLLSLGVSIFLSWWVTRPVEAAWRQQHQFLSDASHELKTPLTVILSNAELLETASLVDRPARWADNIHSEARRMKSLVEEMLTLARADNMVRTSVLSAVSMTDIASDCALLFEPVAFEAGKPLQYEVADGVTVLGDADKLKQVISILLDNAIKYGRDKCPVTMTLQKTGRHARLSVSNAGDPIPPEQLGRLFERFYRADASRGEHPGFGLGLPIAAAITEEHHGTLKAKSDMASTLFLLTLPLKK